MDWIKPFSSRQHAQAGEVLFKKGEPATEMFVVLTGRYRLVETDIKFESSCGWRIWPALTRSEAHADTGVPPSRHTTPDWLWSSRTALLPKSEIRVLFPKPDYEAAVRE